LTAAPALLAEISQQLWRASATLSREARRIDIGTCGALALLSPQGDLLEVVDMPVLRDGPKGRPAVNAPLLAEVVYRWHAMRGTHNVASSREYPARTRHGQQTGQQFAGFGAKRPGTTPGQFQQSTQPSACAFGKKARQHPCSKQESTHAQ
jgi:hypothetical protein